MRKEFKQPPFIQIPTMLIINPKITRLESILFGYIWLLTKLDKELKSCFASNRLLADLCHARPKTVQNSLTNLERQGYILRKFYGKGKRNREEIIPLCDAQGLSLNQDRVSLIRDRGLSLNQGQSDSSPINENRKGESATPSLDVFGGQNKQGKKSKAKKEKSAEDPAAKELVAYLCQQKGMTRPDKPMPFNIADARDLIERFKEKTGEEEDTAIYLAKKLIRYIATAAEHRDSTADYDCSNMTSMSYLTNNFNKLCENYELYQQDNGKWRFALFGLEPG